MTLEQLFDFLFCIDSEPTLLADIFNDVLIETNNENKIKDDNDDLDLLDSDDNEKELVFDDVNYNNNYDSQRPNFYREHRYDIKKPGPKYFEEYFVSSNDNNNEDNEESEDSLQQPQLISKVWCQISILLELIYFQFSSETRRFRLTANG